MSETTDVLKRVAHDAEIELIGVTSAEPFELRGAFNRQQPREILAGARAVVVAGYRAFYEPKLIASKPGTPRGRFPPYGSRAFAQMENHCHATITGFLRNRGFAAAVGSELPIKPAVVRAGLGCYGKHAVVVTPEFGSWIMFACVVTDAPLEHEDARLYEPECPEDCTICMDSCPTGAITEPFRVDTSLCITNWLWGAFAPAKLRAKQENRLFGCGECLAACPMNKHVRPRIGYPVPVDEVGDSPELIPLLTADSEYFRRTLPTFPMRAGIDAIRANAVIALGNIGDPAAVDGLGQTLRHVKPQLRAYSAWALGRIGTARSRALLVAARATEHEGVVVGEIERSLG
jgi:epoxyqueuosine reductase